MVSEGDDHRTRLETVSLVVLLTAGDRGHVPRRQVEPRRVLAAVAFGVVVLANTHTNPRPGRRDEKNSKIVC